jgi:hypothetical protein
VVAPGARGDLRRLRPRDHAGVDGLLRAVAQTPRIGPVGARIFCREVQDVWSEVARSLSRRAVHVPAQVAAACCSSGFHSRPKALSSSPSASPL